MQYGYFKFEIPKRRDAKAWNKLQEKVFAYNKTCTEQIISVAKRRIQILTQKLEMIPKKNVTHRSKVIAQIAKMESELQESIDYYST